VGKTALALELAAMLNCQAPDVGARPCGSCSSCRRIGRNSHQGVAVIAPTGAAFSIDQVRELETDLPLSPQEGGYKVRILTEFSTATREAQNALLKTLEEPPAHAVLILTATAKELLAPTIVSRCQVLTLRPVPTAVIRADLIRRGLPEDEAAALAAESAGRPGWALQALEDDALRQQRKQALQAAADLPHRRRAERIRRAEEWGKRGREAVLDDLELWRLWWHDQMLALAGAGDGYLMPAAERPPALTGIDAAGAARVLGHLGDIDEKIRRNANLRLALTVLVLRLPHLVDSKGS